MILDLPSQGLTVAEIARQTGRDRKTVRKYIQGGLVAPVYGPRMARPVCIDPFKAYLRDRVAAFPGLSGRRLLREIRDIERNGLDTTMPGRIRLATIPNYRRIPLHRFIGGTIEPQSLVVSDGLPSYEDLRSHEHKPIVVGTMAAHVVLPWIHRVFAQLKRWALGVYHGLRPKHLQAYLDEFVFRWNRRRLRKNSLDTLLDIVAVTRPAPYKLITGTA